MKKSAAPNSFTNMVSSSYMDTIRDTDAQFEQSYCNASNSQHQESKCSDLFVGVGGPSYDLPQSQQQPSPNAIIGASAPPLLANVQQPRQQKARLTTVTDTILDQHDGNYQDHHLMPDIEKPLCTTGGVKVQFPVKLYHILEYIDLHEPELAKIISWQPHGRCFRVHDAKKMEELILPRFFNTRHYPSFRRQLSFWGFTRLGQNGPDQGGYNHELFLRGKPYLCRHINRRTKATKATKQSAAVICQKEPEFYIMPVLPSLSIYGPSLTPSAISVSMTDLSLSPSATLVGGPMDLDAYSVPSSKYLHLEDGYEPMKREEYTMPCNVRSSGSMPNKHQDKANVRNGTIAEMGTSALDSGRTLFTTRCVHDCQRDWRRDADQRDGTTTVLHQQDRDCCGRADEEENAYPDDSSTVVDFSPVTIGFSFRLTEEEEEEMLEMLANISS